MRLSIMKLFMRTSELSTNQQFMSRFGRLIRKHIQRLLNIQKLVIGNLFQKIQTSRNQKHLRTQTSRNQRHLRTRTNRSLKHLRTRMSRILKHLTTIRTTMKITTRMRITLKTTMRILPRITTVLKQITVRMILQENSHRKQEILQALLPSMHWQEVRWLALEQ